jgi:hypothetical protein
MGELELLYPPFPNWPDALYPQQNMEPSFIPRHVCIVPASRDTALLLLGIPIITGDVLSV